MRLTNEDILRACPPLRKIHGHSRQRLLDMAVRRRYQKGELIFREGDEPPGMFIVGTGLVRVYKLAPTGKEHALHIAAPGGTFLEAAVMGHFACPAFAEATEPADCLLLRTGPFRDALGQDHQLCLQLLAGMSQRVHHLVQLLEDIVLRDALGRAARYLLDLPRHPAATVHLPSLKKHLASHLNLTSETLSRTLRRLTDLELIALSEGQAVRILNEERLRNAAEGMFPTI